MEIVSAVYAKRFLQYGEKTESEKEKKRIGKQKKQNS